VFIAGSEHLGALQVHISKVKDFLNLQGNSFLSIPTRTRRRSLTQTLLCSLVSLLDYLTTHLLHQVYETLNGRINMDNALGTKWSWLTVPEFERETAKNRAKSRSG
jgi:hypothetical protein